MNYTDLITWISGVQSSTDKHGSFSVDFFPGDNFRDGVCGLSFSEGAALLRKMDEAVKSADLLKKELQKGFDFVRFVALPKIMEKEDIESGRVAGVGTISLISDLNASINGDRKEEAFEWLRDHGHGDLIQPTVNSSTLKAFAKGQEKAGDPLPRELFNISFNTRAQVTKKA